MDHSYGYRYQHAAVAGEGGGGQESQDERSLSHLKRAARAVFPYSYQNQQLTSAGNKMRCGLALWLLEQRACSSAATAGPNAAATAGATAGPAAAAATSPAAAEAAASFVPLKAVEGFLREKHAGLWLNRAAFKWPKVADFLRHPDSRGVFRLVPAGRNPGPTATAAASAARGGGGGGSSSRVATVLAAVAAAGEDGSLLVQLDGGALVAALLVDAEYGYAAASSGGGAAAAAEAATAAAALAKVVSGLAFDVFPEVTIATAVAAAAASDNDGGAAGAGAAAVEWALSAAATAAAGRHLRRGIVAWLAQGRRLDSAGPLCAGMSMLGTYVREELWGKCDPLGGGRPPRLKVLLLDAESRGVFHIVEAAAGGGGSDPVVVLDVAALWRAATDGERAPPLQPPAAVGGSALVASHASSGSAAAPAPAGVAFTGGGTWRAALGGSPAAAAVAAASPAGTQDHPSTTISPRAQPDTAATASSAPSAAATAQQSRSLRTKPVRELSRMAFPTHEDGRPARDQPARRLRRAIVDWLADSPGAASGLGQWRARMSDLGHFLRLQHAALWQNPAHRWPKLKDLLLQPQSRGVFTLLLCSPGLAASEPVVGLDWEALVRAAAWAAAPGAAPGMAEAEAAVEAECWDVAEPAAAADECGMGLREAAAEGKAGDVADWGSNGVTQQQLALSAASAAPAVVLAAAPDDEAAWQHPLPPATAAASIDAPGTAANLLGPASTVADSAAVAPPSVAADGSSSLPPPPPQCLPAADVCVVADPYGSELIAMLQHCGCCNSIGLAVQVYGGWPTLVTLYAPLAMMRLQPSGEAGRGGGESFVQWPVAVYVVDLLAAAQAYGGGPDGDAAAAALLCSLRPLMEEPSVAKVVHGGAGGRVGSPVAALEAAVGACSDSLAGENAAGEVAAASVCHVKPLLDTRLVLQGLEAMLGLPHSPPPVAGGAPAAVAAAAGMVALHGLHAHMARLRDTLAGTGLWADRPQLLAALAARHFAALREEVKPEGEPGCGAGAAEDARVLTRPLSAERVEAAARTAPVIIPAGNGVALEAYPPHPQAGLRAAAGQGAIATAAAARLDPQQPVHPLPPTSAPKRELEIEFVTLTLTELCDGGTLQEDARCGVYKCTVGDLLLDGWPGVAAAGAGLLWGGGGGGASGYYKALLDPEVVFRNPQLASRLDKFLLTATEIAQGLLHLYEALGVPHGDLASRNVLLHRRCAPAAVAAGLPAAEARPGQQGRAGAAASSNSRDATLARTAGAGATARRCCC